MTRFLSKENFEYVFTFARQYLEEAKNIKITDLAEFQKVVATEMRNIGAGTDKGLALEVLNKKAIVAIRDVFLTPDPEPEPQPEPEDENIEDTFFKKLKELEFQRSVAITSSPVAPVTSMQPAEEPPNMPAPAQLPPSTIIVNSHVANNLSVENRVSFRLNSWERLWQYQTERSTFIPEFNLSPDIDNNSFVLRRFVIPNVATITDWIPYFIVTIESAGKQIQDINIYPCLQQSNTHWIHLEPGSPNTIKPLATPWVITVKDAYGSVIDLGHDGWVVRNVIHTQRSTTALEMYHSISQSLMSDFNIGDNIVIRNTQTNKVHRTKIVHTTSSTIEVVGKISDTNQPLVVLNLNRQVSCIIDAKK